jgi:hypothetical protein
MARAKKKPPPGDETLAREWLADRPWLELVVSTIPSEGKWLVAVYRRHDAMVGAAAHSSLSAAIIAAIDEAERALG